jgi:hypothetical protein
MQSCIHTHTHIHTHTNTHSYKGVPCEDFLDVSDGALVGEVCEHDLEDLRGELVGAHGVLPPSHSRAFLTRRGCCRGFCSSRQGSRKVVHWWLSDVFESIERGWECDGAIGLPRRSIRAETNRWSLRCLQHLLSSSSSISAQTSLPTYQCNCASCSSARERRRTSRFIRKTKNPIQSHFENEPSSSPSCSASLAGSSS